MNKRTAEFNAEFAKVKPQIYERDGFRCQYPADDHWGPLDAIGIFEFECVEVFADVVSYRALVIVAFALCPEPMEVGGRNILHRSSGVFAERHGRGVSEWSVHIRESLGLRFRLIRESLALALVLAF